MTFDLQDIALLFSRRGDVAYAGEAVSQVEHALQTAQLAQHAGASDELIASALLHDLGHLLVLEHSRLAGSPTEMGIDDRHQFIALPPLRTMFGPAVLEPIRLHVDAKRYLCATQPGYAARLSPDSQRSLALQGGVYDQDEATAFILQPWARDAIRLRTWDDAAKVPGQVTLSLAHWLTVAERAMPG